MKIMILASCVWNFYQRVTPLCRHLARQGVEVIFVEPIIYRGANAAHLVPKTEQPIPEGVQVIRWRSRLRRGILFTLWQNFRNLMIVLRMRPDVVLTLSVEFAFIAAFFLRFTRIRVILDYIDDWPEWSKVPWEKKVLKHLLIPFMVKQADVCIVTAELLGEDIRKYACKICWIPNGTAEKPAPLKDCEFGCGEGLVFVGGLSPRIDVEWMLDLARALPDIRVSILGGGEQYKTVARAAEQLPNLYAAGFVEHAEAMEAISRAAICLIPYRPSRLTDRCFPIKLPEYWSYGKPVVATACYEMQRVGDGIIQFADTGLAAAEVCRELLHDPGKCAKLGKAGYSKALEYNYEVLAKKFMEVVSKV